MRREQMVKASAFHVMAPSLSHYSTEHQVLCLESIPARQGAAGALKCRCAQKQALRWGYSYDG